MTLQKQTAPVLFEGMDTNVPSELLVPGKMELIKNGVRRKAGLVDKRYGFKTLAQMVIGEGSSITNGEYAFNYKDDLVVLDGNKAYSYLDSTNTWIDKGDCAVAYTSTTSVVRNSFTQATYDTTTLNGLVLSVYEDSRGGVRYTIYNQTSKNYIVSDIQMSATGRRPKCVALESSFIITYLEGANFISSAIFAASPNVMGTTQTLANNAANFPTDLAVYDRYAVFVYNTNASNLQVGYIYFDGTLGNPVTNTLPSPVTIAKEGKAAVTIFTEETIGKICVAYINATDSSTEATCLDTGLVTQTTTVLDAIITSGQNITGIYDTPNSIKVYIDYSSQYIAKVTGDQTLPGGAVTSVVSGNFVPGSGLGSKVFTYKGFQFFLATYQSALQSMYVVIKDADTYGYPIGKLAYGYGQGFTKDTSGALKSYLPNVRATDDSTFSTLISVANRVDTEEGSMISANFGLSIATIESADLMYSGTNFQEAYMLAGSIPRAYDGVSFFDPGFLVYPETLFVGHTAGGSLAAGIYGVTVVAEWTDAKGQVYQSAPAPVQTVTVLVNERIQVSVTNNMLYAYKQGRADFRLVAYRTVVGGAALYRDVTFDYPNTASLEQSDANLQDNQILYTTGGVLENIAPPSSRVVWRHQNRLIFAGLEEGSTVAYTKEAIQNVGLEYSDFLTFRVDSDGKSVTALGSLDDKLILFKPSTAYFTVGEFANALGQADVHSTPQEIPGSLGCDNQSSIVAYPDGLMFKSRKGYWNLSRSTGFEYIGKEVETYNELVVTSAIMLPDEKEIRITTRTGEALIYNHFFKQWSVFDNFQAQSAAYRTGKYYHLKADGRVNQETTGYDDNGSRIMLSVETGWMSFAQVQGFQRVYNFYLLGRLLSQHILRLKFAYDYQDGWKETVDVKTSDVLNTQVWGSDATWGSSSFWGGSLEASSVYQWSVKPRIQKCEAIKISIQDVDVLTDKGSASMSLLHMLFELGVKGADKGAQNKSRGSL